MHQHHHSNPSNLPPPRSSSWGLPANVISASSSSPYLTDCNPSYSMADPNSLYTHPFPPPPPMYHYGPPTSTSPQPPTHVQYGYTNNLMTGNHPYSYMKSEHLCHLNNIFIHHRYHHFHIKIILHLIHHHLNSICEQKEHNIKHFCLFFSSFWKSPVDVQSI